MMRLSPLASETLILSMVNFSWPPSSVFETMRGMYLDAADTEWNGAPDNEDAAADDAKADDAEDIWIAR